MPPDSSAENGVVLYVHGGGFAMCSPRTHRAITTRLAADTGLPVLAPDYRLAPEHPFPAASDDVLDAYRMLLHRGVPAERIIVAGDSSGGHLAVSLIGEARDAGLPVPAGMVLFSPWVDLTCELSAASALRGRDPYIDPQVAIRFGRRYVGSGDWSDPRLSLLTCATAGFPPSLIQVGGLEVLRGDAETLARVLTEAGGSCELQVWPEQMHIFQMLHRFLPEASSAMREAAAFIRTVVLDERAA